MPRAPSILLIVLVILTAVTSLMLVAKSGSGRAGTQQSQEFQQLVRGFGLGPSAELGQCPFACDPRLGCHCAQDDGPIPGGAWICPHHACSVFDYPPLENHEVGALP